MARTSEQIEAIIAELKTNRDARDTQLENAALALDEGNPNKAKKLRGFKHTKQIAIDKSICTKCEVRYDINGNLLVMIHNQYDISDRTENRGEVTELIKGFRTKLVDESFTVTSATTVINL